MGEEEGLVTLDAREVGVAPIPVERVRDVVQPQGLAGSWGKGGGKGAWIQIITEMLNSYGGARKGPEMAYEDEDFPRNLPGPSPALRYGC